MKSRNYKSENSPQIAKKRNTIVGLFSCALPPPCPLHARVSLGPQPEGWRANCPHASAAHAARKPQFASGATANTALPV